MSDFAHLFLKIDVPRFRMEIELMNSHENAAFALHRVWLMDMHDEVLLYLSRQDPMVAAYMALAILVFLAMEETQDDMGFVAAVQKAAAKIQEAAG